MKSGPHQLLCTSVISFKNKPQLMMIEDYVVSCFSSLLPSAHPAHPVRVSQDMDVFESVKV